ncbi:DNA/RNA non-specific endonuclease [Paenibacillus sp. FSL W7-1279]|nr:MULTISPECIES: DNA/RNA non-specific endonuclease [Paenibacillus]
MKKKMNYLILILTIIFMVGCTNVEDPPITNGENAIQEVTKVDKEAEGTITEAIKEPKGEEKVVDEPAVEETPTQPNNDLFSGYERIEVDACDLSGHREPNVVVDVGYGKREYWAFTNEHGQLVRVIADKIILQDDNKEPVSSSGRYCADEAKVPGVESAVLDEGHAIADSLGGVSNAYNITPQDSTLNRHGDQAYMEDAIRKAGGATNFEAIITYPNTKTQIPSSYQYTYTLKGNVIVDKFDNVNPDEVNKTLGLTDSKPSDSKSSNTKATNPNTKDDLSSVDTNGNGKITIKEAKAAGYSMPITSDHWLYKYMDDRDGDGMVGE